jgi:hypothetical protein
MNKNIVAWQPQQNQYSPAYGRQLELFPVSTKREKPQISSVPGISATTRRRYQVAIGDRVIATRLTVDQAWEIAANCAAVTEVDA